jgi:methylase of polypeptide subunit release factors
MAVTRAPALEAYLTRVRGVVASGVDASDAVRSLAASMLRRHEVDVPRRFASAPTLEALVPPPELATPWLLGQVHEALLDAPTRRRAGAHYTPPQIARGLVSLARGGHDAPAPRVCDPAVGGGAFLLAVAESLAAEGAVAPIDVVRHHCFGCDVDAATVEVARATLALWARDWPCELDENIVVADAFDAPVWPAEFDLVVGNPPFLNQLGQHTARDRGRAAGLRKSFGAAATGYVDTAALFLLRGLDLVRPGGRVALVQPHSTLAARDAAGVRAAVAARGRIAGVWFANERVFAAGVRVWAPVLEKASAAGEAQPVTRRVGPDFAPATPVPAPAPAEAGWTSLVVDLTGLPMPRIRAEGVVADVATATAGFRDQFYGLVGSVHEAAPGDERPRLVTSGLIDVLDTSWGSTPARFAGARWNRPVVAVDGLGDAVARWVHAQLVPKLVLATQTKVLEVAVDEQGDAVPSTPVIAVHAPADRLWHLAAALSSPPISAVAHQRGFGAALSTDALKLSARQVLELPLPADHAAWDEAARCAQKVPGTQGNARREALAAFAAAGCAAYGVADDDLVAWWLHRADR